MSKENEGKGKNPDGLESLEDLALRFETPREILTGVMELMNWKPGKFVSEAEYKKGITAFMGVKAG